MAQTVKTLPQAASARRSVPMAERLFASLDGRDLMVGGEAWHIEVYGICEDAGRRWVQMAIDGPRHHMLTLVLATRAGVQQAVDTVTRWLEEPSECPQIRNVA
jgi:hypothetical protein